MIFSGGNSSFGDERSILQVRRPAATGAHAAMSLHRVPQVLRSDAKEGAGHYLNASASTFAHGIRDGRSRWVNHGDEPNEAEIIEREIHIVGVSFKLVFKFQDARMEAEIPCQDCGNRLPG